MGKSYPRGCIRGAIILAGILASGFGKNSQSQAAMLGVNDFDLMRQYLGMASGGDGSDRYRRVEVAMADKALRDSEVNGAAFVRISATGFAPAMLGQRGDLDLWQSDPTAYWGRMDQMMMALDKYSLKAVFSFVWNPLQFPAMTGESVRDLVANSNSKAYGLAARYVGEFVRRYKDRRTVLFYELTNELNLSADLDLLGRCQKTERAPSCAAQGNYTTDEMIAFCRRLAKVIRDSDPRVKISSGFALPRKAAEHIRGRPEWITGKTDFTPDSPSQFEKNLGDIHAMVDIISVHIYPDPDGENARFGSNDPRSTAMLDATVQAARKFAKPLYVGEFGDADRGDGDDSSFTVRMMDKIAELKPEYSSPWVWEFYQTSTYRTHDTRATKFSMEPGITDRQIYRFRQLGKNLGQSGPLQKELERVPPHIVLTWPLDCTLLSKMQIVHAVASDDLGRTLTVQFLLDDKPIARKDAPPYEAQISSADFTSGNHVIKAQASDSAGLQAEYSTPVVLGAVAAGGVCLRTYPSGG